MCPVLATQRGERCYLWRHQFQAHLCLRGHQILLHSPPAGVGKPVCKFSSSCFLSGHGFRFLILHTWGSLNSSLRVWSSITDSRDAWDFTFSLHHLAWLWSTGVSCFLPQLPVQGAGVGLSEFGPGAGGGALQRRHRTLGDVLSCGHLPLTGSYWSLYAFLT